MQLDIFADEMRDRKPYGRPARWERVAKVAKYTYSGRAKRE
jgi:hypothetical protein